MLETDLKTDINNLTSVSVSGNATETVIEVHKVGRQTIRVVKRYEPNPAKQLAALQIMFYGRELP